MPSVTRVCEIQRRQPNTFHQDRLSTISQYHKEVESYLAEKRYKYEAIFSTAAFEHFLKLPTVIRLLPHNLVAEGVLFSIFAPIWSRPPEFDSLVG